jgi:hypothetical protein
MGKSEYLIRCLDGDAKGDMVSPWEWPLPDKLVYFPITKALVAFDAKDREGKTIEWPDDIGLTFYEKVAESQLPGEVDDNPRLMRGAQYRVASGE